jgi:serine phosphatase RsbU (regulator of sigma subunit)
MKTATEIGSDNYDFHVAEDGTFTFALGDATGHGAQAGAMVMATKFIFSNYTDNQDIAEFLAMASQSLKQMRLPRLYMALAIGRIKGNRLEIVGVGLLSVMQKIFSKIRFFS